MNMITSLTDLVQNHANHIIYECIAGSRAYGTQHAKSDDDIRGIFVLPISDYLTISAPCNMVADERSDIVYYSLQRFLQLASCANPNIIELLYMPNDCILYKTEVMIPLFQQRECFITKQAYHSHIGYAQAQLKKAKGQNKWVNNPQPREAPARDKYCWIILNKKNTQAMPYRPVQLAKTNIDLQQCHVARVEHCGHVYRLYQIGKNAKGVFRNDHLVCESIPAEDEVQHCIGLLIYQKEAYERAIIDHKNYWQWRDNRNEQRWQLQEGGAIDYDAKNMMHLFRLLMSGEHILVEGKPLVRFQGDDLAFLRNVLHGQYKYDDLLAMVNDKLTQLTQHYNQSQLPEAVDSAIVDKLLFDLTNIWEAQKCKSK